MRTLEDCAGTDCEIVFAVQAPEISSELARLDTLNTAASRAYRALRPTLHFQINTRRFCVWEAFEKFKSADCDLVVQLEFAFHPQCDGLLC